MVQVGQSWAYADTQHVYTVVSVSSRDEVTIGWESANGRSHSAQYKMSSFLNLFHRVNKLKRNLPDWF